MFITLSFFQTIGNILIFLIVLSIVINIHELGHFFFAKKAGILCHEFSFGMGPRLWSKKFLLVAMYQWREKRLNLTL